MSGTVVRLNHSPQALQEHGPEIRIKFWPKGRRDLERSALAQIDTGSQECAIGPSLFSDLCSKMPELAQAPSLPVAAGGTITHSRQVFAGQLKIRNSTISTRLTVLEFLTPPHDFLLGRNVLAKCRLTVDFRTGFVELLVP